LGGLVEILRKCLNINELRIFDTSGGEDVPLEEEWPQLSHLKSLTLEPVNTSTMWVVTNLIKVAPRLETMVTFNGNLDVFSSDHADAIGTLRQWQTLKRLQWRTCVPVGVERLLAEGFKNLEILVLFGGYAEHLTYLLVS